MSLFRSLQSSPATISIFHSSKLPESVALYGSLEKAFYSLNEDANQFQIDLVTKQMPTYDQFKDINSRCVGTEAAKLVLLRCYPLLSDKMTKSNNKLVTMKGAGVPDHRGVKVFSASEYEKIHQVFDELVHENEPEFDPAHLFRAPLVVDWDQNMIACDEAGLQEILAKYSHQGAEELALV